MNFGRFGVDQTDAAVKRTKNSDPVSLLLRARICVRPCMTRDREAEWRVMHVRVRLRVLVRCLWS